MNIESQRGCNNNDLKGAQIKQMLQIRSQLNYSKLYCIILWAVSQNGILLSFFLSVAIVFLEFAH